ncbi:MAG: MerC domain-containing protein [Xanthomonadales bacterium]|nr:hypothetical protein [Xanthomonadales bacterium]MCC6593561.1 MerC domain-containing protein [Xanthomonadales bacterium]MCE7932287.1 MerC domain-containing protein [Xanthomonadales bacterium PRO6]
MRIHSKHHGSVNWDGLGAGVSLACALHCALLPLIFSLLPGLQLILMSVEPQWQGLVWWLLWNHEAERLVVGAVLLFAAVVLGRGYLSHRSRLPLVLAMMAGGAMALGAFGHWHSRDLAHVLLQVVGGLGVAAAHVQNWRLLYRCVDEATPLVA